MKYVVLAATALMMGGTALAQADTAKPARDARGIPVVSAPAEPPAGANQAPPSGPAVPAPNQQQVFAAQPASAEYPACTKQVTDHCVQKYERGRQPS